MFLRLVRLIREYLMDAFMSQLQLLEWHRQRGIRHALVDCLSRQRSSGEIWCAAIILGILEVIPRWHCGCSLSTNSRHFVVISVLNIYRYHGTADFTLAYPNLAEEMKEWSNVLGVSWSQNISNTPIAGYTRMVYGDGTKLVGFSALDVGHSVPVRTEDDLVWFGLMPSSSATSTATSSKASTTLSTSTTTSSASSTSTAAHWGQW